MANLSRTELQQGNTDRAISAMEQAVARSEDPALRCELGEMYLGAGRWLEAKEHADKAIAQDRQFANAWKLQGKLAEAKGERQHALQLYQRALGYKTECDEIQMLIARSYMEMDQPMRALSATETLLDRHPPDRQPESAIVAKSEALLAMDQSAAAVDVLATASDRPECGKEIFFQLGKAQLLAGNKAAARQTLTLGQERFPQEALFHELASTIDHQPDLNNGPIFDAGGEDPLLPPHRVASVKPDVLTR